MYSPYSYIFTSLSLQGDSKAKCLRTKDMKSATTPTSRPASKRRSKRVTSFMFIDSSNGGVNAKPDRIVRSFVMKSARNRKTWSTRPKSPKEEDLVEAKLQDQLPDCVAINPEAAFLGNSWALQDFRKDSLCDDQATASLTSSRTGSIFSLYGGNHTCDSSSSSPPSPLPVLEQNHAVHAFHLPLEQQAAMTQRHALSIRLRSPSTFFSVYLDPHAQQLLHNFVESSAPRLIPIDLHGVSSVDATDWIARSIQSPNGAPYIYTALTASARRLGLNSEAYKWQAITEVNRLLSDPKTSTDDTTIATVLILLAMEESDLANPKRQGIDRECSLSAKNAHLNGLRTMIAQRGGLSSLNTDRCLQVFILMHSIAQCIATFRRPYALLISSTGQIEDYATGLDFGPHQLAVSIPFQRLCLDGTLLTISHSVRCFVSDLADWYEPRRNLSQLDPFELQKHACLLTYRFFDWYQIGEESELVGRIGRNPMDQSICLAHIIFLAMATEPLNWSFGSRLAKTVVKLRQALQRVPLPDWTVAPEVFLWTLTMGALAAKTLPRMRHSYNSKFAFFVQYSQLLFPLESHKKLASSADILQQVRQCPWIPSIFDERARRLWAQMGLCMPDSVDMYESSSEEEEGPPVDDEHALGQSTAARFFPKLK